MSQQVYGQETKLAMAPIKQKKRRYYLIVVFIVILIIFGLVGWYFYSGYKAEKAYNDALALMETGLEQGDYPRLKQAETAIREEAKRDNPRAAAVAHTILLRSAIWYYYTGEPVLMSDCRKYLEFLEDPEGMYKDDPIVPVAHAVYDAVNDDAAAAIPVLESMPRDMLLPGQREFWLSIAHERNEDLAQAEGLMRKAVELKDSPWHRYGLARILHKQGKDDEAKAEYQKVMQANPDFHAAEAYLLLLNLTPESDVVAQIEGFFQKYPAAVEARIASDLTIPMADAIAATGDLKKAKSAIQQAKINDPGYKPLIDWQPPAPPDEEGEEGKDDKK